MNNDYEVAICDQHNLRVMRAVVAVFEIPRERQPEIMEAAMLRCLENHSHGRQRFTTSLYRFTVWECKNAVRQRSRAPHMRSLTEIPEPASPIHERREDIDHIYECMNMLDNKDRNLIEQYYIQRMTLEEIGLQNCYTKEAARLNVNRATDRLRRLCLRS